MGWRRPETIHTTMSFPSTRDEAIRIGVTRYDTGQPCSRGHLSPRWTATGGCDACLKEHRARRMEVYRLAREQKLRKAQAV